MNQILKAEKETERDKPKLVRWAVYCVQLWEGDFKHKDDAQSEKFTAADECDCGGEHAVLPHPLPR